MLGYREFSSAHTQQEKCVQARICGKWTKKWGGEKIDSLAPTKYELQQFPCGLLWTAAPVTAREVLQMRKNYKLKQAFIPSLDSNESKRGNSAGKC